MVWFTTRKKSLKANGDSFAGKKVVISGSGNVAQYASSKATELVQLLSLYLTQTVTWIDENGIDFDLLTDVKEKRRARLLKYACRKTNC